ncbi:K(+)-transporting ATPase subunit F [Planosporangium thailandense]
MKTGGAAVKTGGEMNAENLAGLIVAVALLGYLVVALLFPERF